MFYFLNATINPILYSVMSKRFRRAFRDKLCSPGLCFMFGSARTQSIGRFAVSNATQIRIRHGESQHAGARNNVSASCRRKLPGMDDEGALPLPENMDPDRNSPQQPCMYITLSPVLLILFGWNYECFMQRNMQIFQ